MDDIAIVVSVISIILAIISFIFSMRSQYLQDKVNELDLRLKKYELAQKEEENRTKTCVEARIIQINSGNYRMKVWNSGNAPAYNVSAHIDDNAQILIVDQEKMPFEILESGNSFELTVIIHMGSSRKFNITTKWKDEKGNNMEKTQLRDI